MLELFWIFWTTLFASLTLNTFFPLTHQQRPPLGHLISFGASWIFGDLAPQWVVLNIGVLGFLLAATPASSWTAGLLLLHGLCGAALLYRWSQQRHLLTHLRVETNTSFEPQRTPALDWWPTVWIPKAHPPGIRRLSGLRYNEALPDSCSLDLYLPDSLPATRRPLLLHIHGGGWLVGTNNQGLPLLHHLVQQGWACAAMTYRLSPQHRHPAALEDVLSATRFLQERADDYQLEAQQFFLSGGSAGAHLASLAAFAAPAQGLNVRGCVCYYGVFNLTAPFAPINTYPSARRLLQQLLPPRCEAHPEEIEKASPFHQIPPQPVPFLFLHGLRDSLIPWEETRAFAQALRAQGGEATEMYVPGVQHSFDMLPSLAAWQMRAPVSEWLHHQLQR